MSDTVAEQITVLSKWTKQFGVAQRHIAHACEIDEGKLSKAFGGYGKLNDLEIMRVADYLTRYANDIAQQVPVANQQLSEVKQAAVNV